MLIRLLLRRQYGGIEILAQRVDAFRPALGQVQALGVAQAADLDAEHLMQFALEYIRAGNDIAQAGHPTALARDAHPQGDHHVPGAEVIEHFHLVRGRPQVQADNGAQVAQALDAQADYDGQQFFKLFNFHIQLVRAGTGDFGGPIPLSGNCFCHG